MARAVQEMSPTISVCLILVKSKLTSMPFLLCTLSRRGQWLQVIQLAVLGSTHVSSGRERGTLKKPARVWAGPTYRGQLGPQGADRPVLLPEHKIQERYSPALLLVTWFVYGRVEESEDVLERGGGHD